MSVVEEIETLFRSHSNAAIISIVKLPQSGSDRIYYRLTCGGDNDEVRSVIATSNRNVKENHTFINFSRHFKNEHAPVPEIIAVNEEATIYLQEDFGDESLLSKLEKHGHND